MYDEGAEEARVRRILWRHQGWGGGWGARRGQGLAVRGLGGGCCLDQGNHLESLICVSEQLVLVAAQGLEWCFVAPDVLEAQRSLRKTSMASLLTSPFSYS